MKIKLSTTGRDYDLGTFEIDVEQSNAPHLTVSKGEESYQLTFTNDAEMGRFSKQIGMCRTRDQRNREVYVTGFK